MGGYSDMYKDMQYAEAVEQSKRLKNVPVCFRPMDDYQEVQKRDLLVKVVQSNGFGKSFVMSVHRIDGGSRRFTVIGRSEGYKHNIVMVCDARVSVHAMVKEWPVTEEVTETATAS